MLCWGRVALGGTGLQCVWVGSCSPGAGVHGVLFTFLHPEGPQAQWLLFVSTPTLATEAGTFQHRVGCCDSAWLTLGSTAGGGGLGCFQFPLSFSL